MQFRLKILTALTVAGLASMASADSITLNFPQINGRPIPLSDEIAMIKGSTKQGKHGIYLRDRRRFTDLDGYCFISGIRGSWAGRAEIAKFYVEKGEWYLEYRSGGSENDAWGRCVRYPKQ